MSTMVGGCGILSDVPGTSSAYFVFSAQSGTRPLMMRVELKSFDGKPVTFVSQEKLVSVSFCD